VGAARASVTLRTKRSDRVENMNAFALRALELLAEVLERGAASEPVRR
jgi:hypothetical protein